MMMENSMSEITLYHGDCLVEMNKIADKSVDLILTDPPFALLKRLPIDLLTVSKSNFS